MSNVQGIYIQYAGIYVQRAGYIDPTNSVKKAFYGAKFKKKYLWHTKPKGVMMMLKYSLSVFCFCWQGIPVYRGIKRRRHLQRSKQRAQTLYAQDPEI